MAVLIGIDEAGFGPILGPLVVSSSGFSLPRRLLSTGRLTVETDLWRILRTSLGSRRKGLAGRLLVTDSKKAYSRSLGIKHLQRTVLTYLRCLDKRANTLAELVALLCPDCLQRLNDYPWYKGAEDYKIGTDEADMAIASAVLKKDLAANGIKFLGFESHCLDVAYYNKMMVSVKNKANVLFTATSGLIKCAFDNFGGDDLQIIIDRQGGRIHYRKNLQRTFGGLELKILSESATASSYELWDDGKRVRLHFVVGAEQRFLPAALASMVSKYLRELLVDNINRYFTRFHAELRPTAGYWKDGLRFIEDLKTNTPHIQYDRNQLIRCR